MNSFIVLNITQSYIEIGKGGYYEPEYKYEIPNPPLRDYSELEMSRFFKKCFREGLQMATKDIDIILCEEILCSLLEKQKYCVILLRMLQCSSVIPSPIMHCLSSGTRTGLVINIDYCMATCTPIYDLRIMDHFLKSTSRAKKWLLSRGSSEASEDGLHSIFISDDMEVPIVDADEKSINSLIKEVLRIVPIDTRSSIQSNLIISGISISPTLIAAIEKDTEAQIIKCLGSWQGASLYSSILYRSDIKDNMLRITRESFLERDQKIPDWYNNRFEASV